MKSFLKILFLAVFFLNWSLLFSSQFEELDKPPEGAHEGQMILGGFFSIGLPGGDAITDEEDFLNGNTYTFSESQITKELLVNHLSYDFGVFFEYMPFDYVGGKTKLRRTVVVQRTAFGSDYQNWTEDLYENYSLVIGPSFHLNTRKQWDVVFTPEIGYAIAQYHATPIADKLVSGYSGDMDRDVNGIIYGAELSLAIYFSGGFYLSLGGEWTNYPLAISPGYNLSQNGNTYKDPSSLQTINITVSAGYAFSN